MASHTSPQNSTRLKPGRSMPFVAFLSDDLSDDLALSEVGSIERSRTLLRSRGSLTEALAEVGRRRGTRISPSPV
jgi:hypothetical protein